MKYNVRNYETGEKVGEIELTETEFAEYLAVAYQLFRSGHGPQRTLRIGNPAAFPYYKLYEEYQDLGSDTLVYLD